MRRDRVGLPGLEGSDDAIAVRGHIEGKEFDEDIVLGNQRDNLTGLGFIELATLDFDRVVRPSVAQPQECLEEVVLDRTWNHQRQNEREKRLAVCGRYEVACLVDEDPHYV